MLENGLVQVKAVALKGRQGALYLTIDVYNLAMSTVSGELFSMVIKKFFVDVVVVLLFLIKNKPF
jgi:hypothetical protein